MSDVYSLAQCMQCINIMHVCITVGRHVRLYVCRYVGREGGIVRVCR